MFEVPETDTSMRIYEEDINRIRNLVGQSDTQRIHIAVESLETRLEADPINDEKKIIPMNSEDKQFICQYPGESQSDKFHSFVYSLWQSGINEKLEDPRAINS